jgi:inner membrane protein
MLPWWIWAVGAAVLALAEMHAPGSYLIWVACGFGATSAGTAVFGLSLHAQIITVTIASCLSCVVSYFAYRRVDTNTNREPALNERARTLIGRNAVVSTEIIRGDGKVRLGDTVWLANGPDLPAGTNVTVTAASGPRLQVEPCRDGKIPSAEAV